MKKIHLLLAMLSLFQARAETVHHHSVTLYLQPTTQAAVATRVPAGEALLQQALPVEDSTLAAAGWKWLEWEQSLQGYIDPSAIRADQTVRGNTYLYAEGKAQSKIITTLDEGEAVTRIANSPFWTEVAVQRVVPVYFQAKQASSSPAAASKVTAIEPLEPMETTVARDPAVSKQAAEELPPLRTTTPATQQSSASIVEVTPLNPSSESAIIRTPDSARTAFAAATTDGTGLRYFQGIFRAYRPSLLTFNPQPYRYELVTPKGERIAYLDLQQSILPGSAEQYVNKRVLIHGTPKVLDERSRDIVIQVRNLKQR